MSFTEFQTNLSENITKREKLPKKRKDVHIHLTTYKKKIPKIMYSKQRLNDFGKYSHMNCCRLTITLK